MKVVLSYLRPYFGRMGGGFAIKTLATLAELLIPYILSHILEEVLSRGVGDILLWGGGMIVCAAIALIGNVIANRMAARVSRNFAEELRRDLFLHTLRLSARETDRFTIPSLESRITTDTYNIHGFINMMQRMGVRAPIMLIGGIAITLFMDAKLSLVMIALLPVIFATIYLIRRSGVPLYGRVQKSLDGMIQVVREDAGGIRVIKALSKEGAERRRYARANRRLSRDEVRAGVAMGSVNPLMTLFMNAGSVAVIALGARFVAGGSSSPETIIAFMQYFTQISMAMMAVTRIFVMYTKSDASARRIAEVLASEDEIKVLPKESYPDRETDAHILFERVSFSYAGKTNQLSDVSFSLPRGGHLGIIGATGSGKSTLVRLLLRFYDAGEGEIYINGENCKTIEKERLYSYFGVALQKDFLFADSIEENIRFGRDLPHEAVVRAARIAQADSFIRAFPEGYEHRLSPHGTNISGGQKQRLLIARALAGNPDILVLDDSSSALDYRTDAALREALSREESGTTVVTVAQRVSSVKNCDLILVLDEGKVIGAGRHEQLLESCPVYREIEQSQMGGAILD